MNKNRLTLILFLALPLFTGCETIRNSETAKTIIKDGSKKVVSIGVSYGVSEAIRKQPDVEGNKAFLKARFRASAELLRGDVTIDQFSLLINGEKKNWDRAGVDEQVKKDVKKLADSLIMDIRKLIDDNGGIVPDKWKELMAGLADAIDRGVDQSESPASPDGNLEAINIGELNVRFY